MSWLCGSALDDLGDLLDSLRLRSHLCPCMQHFTAVVRMRGILCEFEDRMVVQTEIAPENTGSWGFRGDHFLGVEQSMVPAFCKHKPLKEFALHINRHDAPILQYDGRILLFNAKNCLHKQPPFIDARDIRTGMLRLDEDHWEKDRISFGEIFSGGFSGWSHTIRPLINEGMPFDHMWSVDHDAVAASTFTKSHQEFQHVQSPSQALMCSELHEAVGKKAKLMFQCDIRHAWFLTHLPPGACDVAVMSPPCQPWSTAHSAQGINRHDGRTLLYGCGTAAICRPKIICFEEVAGFSKHSHFPLFLRLMHGFGYEVLDHRCLNLRQILPQNRDRWLCIAIDKSSDDVAKFMQWISWPTCPQMTLRTSECIMNYEDIDVHGLIPSTETLAKYLDPKMLPRFDDDLLSRVKTKMDIRKYRVKDLESSYVSCIMANYGKATDLPEDVLKKGGIFGSLVMQNQCLRFLHAAEVAMLMGTTNPIYLPIEHDVQMHLLGNGISIPHALICILNAVRLFKNPKIEIDIHDLFSRVMTHRMKSHCIEIIDVHEGIVIQHKKGCGAVDDPTQPMQSFVPMHVRSPTTAFVVQVECGLKIGQVIDLLTGPSCPSVLELEIQGQHVVQLLPHDRIQSDVCIVKTGVPSILNMKDSLVHTTTGDMIVILTSTGMIVCKRKSTMLVHEITQMVHDFFPDKVDCDARPCNEFGMQFSEGETCPDCLFMTTSRQPQFQMDPMEIPTFRKQAMHFEMVCSVAHAIKVIQMFDRASISEGCKCLGWAFHIIPTNEKSSNKTKIVLAPIVGALAVTIDQIRMYVMTQLAIAYMPEKTSHEMKENELILKVKMWGTCVWDGPINKDVLVGKFIESWNKARYVMGADENLHIRVVIKGKQANPDYAIGEYTEDDTVVKMHMVLGLHGGGKVDAGIEAKNSFAVFMIQQGADLQQTTHLAEVMMRSVGLQTMQKTMMIERVQDRLSAFKALAAGIHATWPEFVRSDASRFQKVQNAAKNKRFVSGPIRAAQISLIPETFCNEDDTIATVQQQVVPGSSGIVLLDPSGAEPWVVDQKTISADEMCVLVLGHDCPANNGAHCKPVQVPANNEDGKPIVIKACMHNLGQKMIKIKQCLQDDVPVSPSTVVAITIYRDELKVDEWHHVEQHPVKFALVALGISDNSAVLTPPWGRSWQCAGSKVDPSRATSVQFHARIESSKLHTYMKASGHHGTYIVPKSDSNVPDTSYAVVWYDAAVVDLCKIMTDIPQHLGQVRIVRGKGDNAKTSRGVRCKRTDFESIFKQLRPSDTIPNVSPVTNLYKLQSCPKGASAEIVATWLGKQKIQARPLKALASTVWLIGASEDISEKFFTWNGQSIMLSRVQSKYHSKPSPVIAGKIPQIRDGGKPKLMKDGVVEEGTLRTDPWANYTATSNGTSSVGKGPVVANPAPRSVDAPTESRFKQTDSQIANLEKQFESLKKHVEQRDSNDQVFQAKVTTEFANIRGEISQQVTAISAKFDQSLQHALSKQDAQISSGFDEIKQMLRCANQPQPQKKQRAQPKINPDDPDEDM